MMQEFARAHRLPRPFMVLTPSSMRPLDSAAPDFSLPDTLGRGMVSLAQVRGARATLVMFLCNHCPYVKHVNPELVRMSRDYAPRGVGLVAISSNDADAYPQDARARMTDTGRALGYDFPYLHDATQDVARAYGATCTPDFFLFDAQLRLAYRGRLDDSTPGNGRALTGADLRAALEALLAGRAPDAAQSPSLGCNIKWRG